MDDKLFGIVTAEQELEKIMREEAKKTPNLIQNWELERETVKEFMIYWAKDLN